MHTPKHDPIEEQAIELVEDIQKELASALNSLGGRKSSGIHDHYFVHGAGHVNSAADGFIRLRREGRVDASKLLVRPVIEILFRIEAVRRTPEMLFQIAYSERLEDERWFSRLAPGSWDPSVAEKEWQAFKAQYAKQCPSHSLTETKLTVFEIAKSAQLDRFYNGQYRMYCQYEHGASRATSGSLDSLSDSHDSRTMAFCAFVALNALVSNGVSSSSLGTLKARLDQLDEALVRGNYRVVRQPR